MAVISRRRVLRIACWFSVVFVALFVFRLLYGYYGARTSGGAEYDNDFFSQQQNLRKNYASEKILNNRPSPGPVGAGGEQASTQQYEKTATVRSKSSQFEEDEAVIRKQTESYGGAIQYEHSMGRKGSRELYLSIGVKPAVFDSFYRAVQHIGELKSMSITKVDKTTEYLQLNAKKASLEKTLTSLNELKSKGGAIGDYVSLLDKIQELETQLRELGVDLGNYNSENEFCTLRFSLFEGAAATKISGWHRVKIALEWTITYYAIGVAALAGVLVCSLVLLVIGLRLRGLVSKDL